MRTPIKLSATRMDAWRIERQMLGRSRAGTPAEVSHALVGVQAQVMSCASLAIALRSTAAPATGVPTDQTALALRERGVVRCWGMRGTLHLFSAADVPTVAAALGRKERWRRPAWLRWFGMDEREMEALIDAIGLILDDGQPRTRAELADEIGGRLGPKAGALLLGSWGSALKVASDRHYLVQSAEEEAGVRFVRASRWVPDWRIEDQTEALASLIERYLAAYGPATLPEIRRWWGVATLAEIRPAMALLADRLAQVDVDGTHALVRSADIDSIASTPPATGEVMMVGGFDPLIVGAGLRDRLIPAANLKRVSRTAGWISPVVVLDGRAVGVWDSTADGTGLEITVESFTMLAPALRSAIAAAAERIGIARGLPVRVTYGRVYEGKRSTGPFNDR